MSWEYSELSKTAKKFGGPNRFLTTMCKEKIIQGRKQMIPVTGALIILAVAADRIYLAVKNKHQQNAERAKEKLIEGIQKYEFEESEQPKSEVKEGTNTATYSYYTILGSNNRKEYTMGFLSDLFDVFANASNNKDCDWFCDECGAYLNSQPGFTARNDEWTCTECGSVNDVSEDNIIDEEDEDDSERISVYDAAEIWLSNGKDEDYMFGYSEEELEDAL